MSIEMENPKTLVELIDASANLVAQIRLAMATKDNGHATKCVDRASELLALALESAERFETMREALRAADKDICEHLQVARYNLTGMTKTGDQMPIPDPPLLIHDAGIRASEDVLKRIWASLKETHPTNQ